MVILVNKWFYFFCIVFFFYWSKHKGKGETSGPLKKHLVKGILYFEPIIMDFEKYCNFNDIIRSNCLFKGNSKAAGWSRKHVHRSFKTFR